jgi:hypothetical protein
MDQISWAFRRHDIREGHEDIYSENRRGRDH